MSNDKVCRVCLDMNRKLLHLKENSLELFYKQVTGLSIGEEDRLPQELCWECAQRLVSCSRFRAKALCSHSLLTEVLHSAHYLTTNNLSSIDRYANNLTSSLACKTFDVNHSDLHLYDTAPLRQNNNEKTNNNDSEEIQLDLEVKSEVDEVAESNDLNDDVFLNEDSVQSTSSNETLVKIKKRNSNKKIKTISRKKVQRKVSKKTDVTLKIDRRRKPANEVLNEEMFLITDLSYEEQLFEIHKRQESSNYTKAEFRCAACFKGFLDEEAYKCHVIRHTDQGGAYECEICKVRFKKRHALRNHTTLHMQRFSCKRCPYVTTRRHGAKLHEEYHKGTRYQCPHCLEDFSKSSTFMSHVRIKHPSDFVCALCGHSFVSGKGLGLHTKLKHRFDERPIPPDGPYCERCDVRFASIDALERHVKLSARHNSEAELKENSSRKRARRQHGAAEKSRESNPREKKEPLKKKIKSNCKPEGPISCEQCDTQLPDSVSYYRHFRRTHPDKNRTNYPSMRTKCMCEVCGKMFQSLALLQDHSFTHTDSKQFQCAQCEKTFQRKYRLIAHRKLHAAQRATHACSLCGKHFTTTSNMQRHMVSHTGLKPFKCEMCGKCFKHASEKRVHITYVHLKKPWPKRTRGKRRADGRQNFQPQPTVPTEMDIVQPPWTDPKLGEVVIHDKPAYYSLKM